MKKGRPFDLPWKRKLVPILFGELRVDGVLFPAVIVRRHEVGNREPAAPYEDENGKIIYG